MGDIELVIKIPKEIYNHTQEYEVGGFNQENDTKLFIAIKNGTLLPKGHGRLIDADVLYDSFIDGTEGYDCQTWNRIEIGDIVEDAPTIIEADKTESEK